MLLECRKGLAQTSHHGRKVSPTGRIRLPPIAMGSGASFASQVGQASVADLQKVVADFSPEEREKVKVALNLVRPPKKSRIRVKCQGRTFAPYGIRTDLPAQDPPATKDFTPYMKHDDLPEKVDLRKFMSEVEDQSQTNSCCANAVAGAYEYLNMKHARENGDVPGDVSRLFIYYVGRKQDMHEEAGMFGKKAAKVAPKDEGMSISAAITAMQVSGTCLADSWPYDLDKVNERPTDECFKEARKYRVVQSQKVPHDVDAMRECLAEGNPIVFGLLLTDKFFCPGPSGFIQTPAKGDQRAASHGLHAMLIVGYNDRQQVFIVRNSWGPLWGDKGYCYVGYDYAGNMDFNFLQQYTITGLTCTDFTPDCDDGEDFDITDDGPDVIIEEEEQPEEPDAEDDFDFSETFKGDQVIRQYFIEEKGVLNRSQFQICLCLFHRSEAGKNFDWLAADTWVADESNFPPDKIEWTPEDFNEIVTKFYKKSDAELYPNLAFLWS